MTDLWVSMSVYGGLSTREILTIFEEAGIRSVELAIGPKPDLDAAQAIADYRQLGFRYRAHHAFVWSDCHTPFNLSDRRLNWSSLQSRICWMAEMGITEYSVHAGHYAWGSNRAVAYEKFLQNLERLNLECRAASITLGVETMYQSSKSDQRQYLLDSVGSIQEFMQVMPEVKLVLDLAHLNIGYTSDRTTLFDVDSDRLLEIHISDNDGRRDLHSQITSDTWWMSWRDAIPKQVPLILESRMNRQGALLMRQHFEQVCNWLK